MERRTTTVGVIGVLFAGGICVTLMVITTGVLGWLGFSNQTSPRLTRITLLSSLAQATPMPSEPEKPMASVKPDTLVVAPVEKTESPATVVTQTAVMAAEIATPIPLSAEALGRLTIPKIGLDAPVILAPMGADSWQVDHLGQTVGYLEGTALPGTDSNVVLAAHVSLVTGVAGPFNQLNLLSTDDVIWVHYQGRVFQYVVKNAQEVDPATIAVTYPSSQGQITLITCSQWDETQGRYLDRLVVKGRLVGE